MKKFYFIIMCLILSALICSCFTGQKEVNTNSITTGTPAVSATPDGNSPGQVKSQESVTPKEEGNC